MTKLPISGGAYTRDDKGGLKRAEAPTGAKPPRARRTAPQKSAPTAKPEQKKDSDK
ncbi:hypothetical protein [uncultured Roseovarius sp.]|uniref:hypothetical protein n=1 Tax=uncultured Roseovarius sp. TaxID=293344 RepID=UPI0026308B99|nr:hypothetical protein [uncultured Roseovarius sp.]